MARRISAFRTLGDAITFWILLVVPLSMLGWLLARCLGWW